MISAEDFKERLLALEGAVVDLTVTDEQVWAAIDEFRKIDADPATIEAALDTVLVTMAGYRSKQHQPGEPLPEGALPTEPMDEPEPDDFDEPETDQKFAARRDDASLLPAGEVPEETNNDVRIPAGLNEVEDD